jgi:hypothetical protein
VARSQRAYGLFGRIAILAKQDPAAPHSVDRSTGIVAAALGKVRYCREAGSCASSPGASTSTVQLATAADTLRQHARMQHRAIVATTARAPAATVRTEIINITMIRKARGTNIA